MKKPKLGRLARFDQKGADVISQLSNDQPKSGLEIVIGRFPALLATKE
jgi:hypothetical protein